MAERHYGIDLYINSSRIASCYNLKRFSAMRAAFKRFADAWRKRISEKPASGESEPTPSERPRAAWAFPKSLACRKSQGTGASATRKCRARVHGIRAGVNWRTIRPSRREMPARRRYSLARGYFWCARFFAPCILSSLRAWLNTGHSFITKFNMPRQRHAEYNWMLLSALPPTEITPIELPHIRFGLNFSPL